MLDSIDHFYSSTLSSHGQTAEGAGWNSQDSQILRFDAIAELFKEETNRFSLVDYGCGYGAFLRHLRSKGFLPEEYWGYDFCEPMINAALAEFKDDQSAHFTREREALPASDYCVASGIFSVKLDASNDDWHDHILKTIQDMAALATRGLAFNALTTYSDPERLRPDLYYADPLELFDYCKRNLSRRVALLHDYRLYDFTIIVRFGW
jgi:SAM-dependent methyltransferase